MQAEDSECSGSAGVSCEPEAHGSCVDLAVTNFDAVPCMTCTSYGEVPCLASRTGTLGDGGRAVDAVEACCHCGGGRNASSMVTLMDPIAIAAAAGAEVRGPLVAVAVLSLVGALGL